MLDSYDFVEHSDGCGCLNCQEARERAWDAHAAEQQAHLDSLGPGGEDAPQMWNTDYYKGF